MLLSYWCMSHNFADLIFPAEHFISGSHCRRANCFELLLTFLMRKKPTKTKPPKSLIKPIETCISILKAIFWKVNLCVVYFSFLYDVNDRKEFQKQSCYKFSVHVIFSFWTALIFNGIHTSARLRTTSSTLLKRCSIGMKNRPNKKKHHTNKKTIRKTLFDWEKKNIAPVVKINIYWLDYYYYSGSGWDDDR